MVRDKIKKFAQLAVTTAPNQTQNGKFYPVPPYKVLPRCLPHCLRFAQKKVFHLGWGFCVFPKQQPPQRHGRQGRQRRLPP